MLILILSNEFVVVIIFGVDKFMEVYFVVYLGSNLVKIKLYF